MEWLIEDEGRVKPQLILKMVELVKQLISKHEFWWSVVICWRPLLLLGILAVEWLSEEGRVKPQLILEIVDLV